MGRGQRTLTTSLFHHRPKAIPEPPAKINSQFSTQELLKALAAKRQTTVPDLEARWDETCTLEALLTDLSALYPDYTIDYDPQPMQAVHDRWDKQRWKELLQNLENKNTAKLSHILAATKPTNEKQGHSGNIYSIYLNHQQRSWSLGKMASSDKPLADIRSTGGPLGFYVNGVPRNYASALEALRQEIDYIVSMHEERPLIEIGE